MVPNAKDVFRKSFVQISTKAETQMNSLSEHKTTKAKPARKLLVTMAVSAPIIFWIIALFD
jgi:hypothetical protein